MTGRRSGSAAIALAAALLLGGCGSGDGGTGAGGPGDPSEDGAASSGHPVETHSGPTEQTREDFVQGMAAHLCAAQARVYDDPADLAQAYGSLPRIDTVTRAEAEALSARLQTDTALSQALNEAVRSRCG